MFDRRIKIILKLKNFFLIKSKIIGIQFPFNGTIKYTFNYAVSQFTPEISVKKSTVDRTSSSNRESNLFGLHASTRLQSFNISCNCFLRISLIPSTDISFKYWSRRNSPL